MPPLTPEQVDALLAGPMVARLATVKPDGAPYVVPIWQYWDGEVMYLIPRGKSRFVEYLKREPRVAISCADDNEPSRGRILIEGEAEIVDGPTLMSGATLEIAKEMAERYGGEGGLTYLEGTMDMARYLVRVRPTKMTTWAGGWHPRYT